MVKSSENLIYLSAKLFLMKRFIIFSIKVNPLLFSLFPENYKTDYSKALGEFELESQLFYSGRLCIKKIDETSVVYDLQYDMANDYRVDIDTGNDLIATFDALNGEFCIGNNSIQKDILFHLTYNNENDQWSANYYDKFCRN